MYLVKKSTDLALKKLWLAFLSSGGNKANNKAKTLDLSRLRTEILFKIQSCEIIVISIGHEKQKKIRIVYS